MFGHQIKKSISIIHSRINPTDAGLSGDEITERLKLAKQFIALIMQVIISLLVIFKGVEKYLA